MNAKVLILGGGTGGVVVANRLAKAIGKTNDITLIDKDEKLVFNPSLLWIIPGSRKRDQIQRPLSNLQKKGINFVNASVENIDFDKKTVSTSGETFGYDYLVITLGATLYPDKLLGFSENAHDIYDLDGVEKFTSALDKLETGRVVVLISSMPFKCPAAPYEAAFFINEQIKKHNKKIEVDLVTPEPAPMGVAGEIVSNSVISMLQNQDIGYHTLHQAASIDSKPKQISFKENNPISYDLIAGIPPHGLPAALDNAPILGESGWVSVDPYTMETNYERVFALGDVTDIPLTLGKPLPKAGVFAQHQAEVVAKRIISDIRGDPLVAKFEGNGSCFLEIGGGKAAFASGNFYAQPAPEVKMKNPSRFRHWTKVIFEKYWLRKFL